MHIGGSSRGEKRTIFFDSMRKESRHGHVVTIDSPLVAPTAVAHSTKENKKNKPFSALRFLHGGKINFCKTKREEKQRIKKIEETSRMSSKDICMMKKRYLLLGRRQKRNFFLLFASMLLLFHLRPTALLFFALSLSLSLSRGRSNVMLFLAHVQTALLFPLAYLLRSFLSLYYVIFLLFSTSKPVLMKYRELSFNGKFYFCIFVIHEIREIIN